jgi:hypothetical protein
MLRIVSVRGVIVTARSFSPELDFVGVGLGLAR